MFILDKNFLNDLLKMPAQMEYKANNINLSLMGKIKLRKLMTHWTLKK